MAKREPPFKIEASFEDAVRAFLKTPPPPGHPTRKQKPKKTKAAKKR